MDINDFNGTFKYKLIIPTLFVLSWIFMFLGPAFFQVQYQKYCVGLVLYLCFRTTIMFACSIVAFFKSLGMFSRYDKLKTNNQEPVGIETQLLKKQILHAYIIPNFKEDVDLLIETIEKIAEHPWAKERSMVFLGMQAHEINSKDKAEEISKIFKNKFRMFGYTIHHIKQFEQKGKASNVSWCVEHLQEQFFKPKGINIDNVMLTIIDADSWIPDMYVRQLEDHLTQSQNYPKKHKFIYQPNQVFTRNHLDIPVFTRCYDQFYACMHHSNTMVSMFDAGFPLSNYTMSYCLVKQIGFWDTVPDAIGEDFHTTIKAFWKTSGDVYTIPIFTPFNQINIQTGKGYCADLQARFWQSERHSRGVADVAYNVNMLIKQPFKFRTLVIALNCIEIFFLPATVPWALFAMTLQSQILFKYIKPSPELISDQYIGLCFKYATILFWIVYAFYYYIKRKTTSQFYKLQNESFFRIIEYPLFFLFNMITISLPSMVIAVFGVLFQNREYIVAQKVLNKKSGVDRHQRQFQKDVRQL